MGLKTTLSILRFEFHALGAGIIAALLMAGMFYLFGNSEQDFAVLVSFAVLVFLVSLVRIDLGLAILIIGMLFSPEAIVGQAHRRIVTIRAEDLLIVALMAAWVVRSVLLGMAVRSTPLNVPILLFVIAAGISTLGGIALPYFVDPVEAAFYVGKLIEFFAVYFFAVHFIEDEKRLHLFLGLFLLVGAAVSLYGLSQVGEVRRITAPFEGSVPEPNTFGGYLMTVIGLCIPFAVFTPYASLRFLLLAIAGIAFTALLYTLSRASFIALVGMFIVLGMLTKSRMMWLAFFIFLLVHRVIL
ncbi:MAG: hypothetical protein KC978_20500, partial [Candidatus Omnitrophica bacterium]|nr:hypothetical protein [Candidatus Omnitrophota bacterium]